MWVPLGSLEGLFVLPHNARCHQASLTSDEAAFSEVSRNLAP